MSIDDYIIMLAFTLGAAYGLMHMVRWLRNWVATGAYRAGSEKIPAMAWPLVAVAMLLILAFLNLPAIWSFFYE